MNYGRYQKIGDHIVVLRLDEYDGMPPEAERLCIVIFTDEHGGRKLYLVDPRLPLVREAAMEPPQFVQGVLTAADELWGASA